MEIEKSEKNETPYFWGISYMRQNLSPRISNKDFNFSSFSLPNLILTETLKKMLNFSLFRRKPWIHDVGHRIDIGSPGLQMFWVCWKKLHVEAPPSPRENPQTLVGGEMAGISWLVENAGKYWVRMFSMVPWWTRPCTTRYQPGISHV